MNTTVSEILFHEEPRPLDDAVMQRPEDVRCVPVDVVGPVTTHELPARGATTCTEVATTAARDILSADRTRKRATLISTDNPFYVAYSRNPNINTPGAVGGLWPANVPLIITHCDWVTVWTPNGNATIAVLTEQWAD